MDSRYIDHMGTDLSVVNAARVSFANISDWVRDDNGAIIGLKRGDINLINFLARGTSTKDWETLIEEMTGSHNPAFIEETVKSLMGMATHWSPFSHTAISLRMKAPVPIRTQCFKHKQGFTENEESRRYISSRPELFIPEYFRSASPDKKQGSGGKHQMSEMWIRIYQNACENMINLYEDMIANEIHVDDNGNDYVVYGIAPEQARFILPQGVEVNWVWTGNLAAFARFFNQRTDDHAQKEVQDLANIVGEIIEPLFPVSWKALTG